MAEIWLPKDILCTDPIIPPNPCLPHSPAGTQITYSSSHSVLIRPHCSSLIDFPECSFVHSGTHSPQHIPQYSNSFSVYFMFRFQLKAGILFLIETFPQPYEVPSRILLSLCHLLPHCWSQHSNFWGLLSTTNSVSILTTDSTSLLSRVYLVGFSSIPLQWPITQHTPDLVISNKSFTVCIHLGDHFLNNATCPVSSFGIPSMPVLLPHRDLLGFDCTTFLLIILSPMTLFPLLVYIPCSIIKITVLHVPLAPWHHSSVLLAHHW